MRVRLTPASGLSLADRLVALRRELEIPAQFPAAVLEEAAESHAAPPQDPRDVTDLPFVTLDPPGSKDLDQAFLLERRGSGYRVHYAIADVAAFVRPGGALDAETHVRGETLYSPDTRTPLHPDVLGEGRASLLPGEDRPAVLWTVDLDADGVQTSVTVERATIRSRAQLDYGSVQQMLDSGSADEMLRLLPVIGALRRAQQQARGAVNLPEPEQVVVEDSQGFRLAFRTQMAVEDDNAQLSLLTGMAAAGIMIQAKVGVLRTMPPPSQESVDTLRRAATALGVPWPAATSYQQLIAGLDTTVPAQAALCQAAAVLLRGAGYTAFDGSDPELTTHSAVAAPYAHATAPLRRLADRYVSEVCLRVTAGNEVPDWVRAALPALPGAMAAADHRAHELERATLDLVEAFVLTGREGQSFDAVVLSANTSHGVVQLRDPAVRARCDGASLPVGQPLTVRLAKADAATRTVVFVPA